MFNELICCEEGATGRKFSFAKLCARGTYFLLGAGSGVLTRYVLKRREK